MQNLHTKKQSHDKSLSHWLTYNWGWILGGAALLAVLVYSALSHTGGPRADYTVTWVGTTYLSEGEVEAICQAIAQAGADQNGDGAVVTDVVQYVIDFTLTGEDHGYADSHANNVKLLAHLQAEDCLLFLLEDPEQFQRSTGALRYLDGAIPTDVDGYECANWQRMCLFWQPEGLEHQAYLGLRALFSGEESLFPGAAILFDAITDGC